MAFYGIVLLRRVPVPDEVIAAAKDVSEKYESGLMTNTEALEKVGHVITSSNPRMNVFI